jgi:hypothetical protein
MKHLTFVKNWCPSPLLKGKARVDPSKVSDCLTRLPSKIELVWKSLLELNTLAYYAKS